MKGVMLYGAPATGKDTVTRALVDRFPDVFVHFWRLKAGPGRTAGYRMVSLEHVEALPESAVLWTNHRYGATYVVDREGLSQIWSDCRIPIVHLGQPEAVDAIVGRTPEATWLVVELYSSLTVLKDRIRVRATGDDDQRITAALNTPRLPRADVSINTGSTQPDEAAQLIAERMLQQKASALRSGR